MIEMQVRVDDVADRLARDDLLDCVDDRDRSRLGGGRIDDHDVVTKFHDDALRAAGHDPDAVGDLLWRKRFRGRFPLSDGRRHLNRRRGIGLDVGDHQIEQRIPAGSLKNVRREFHAAEILVVLEDGFDHHVAQDRVADPCFNPLDEVLVVQHAFELGLVRRRDRDDRLLRAAHGFGGDGRIAGHRRLDEPVRRHPDLRQPPVDRRPLIPFGRGRYRSLIDQVPGVGTAQEPDLPHLGGQRLGAPAERRVLDLRAPSIVTDGRRRVVDGGREGGQVEPRPGSIRIVGLAEDVVRSPSGELDRVEVGGAHGFRSGIERRFRVLGPSFRNPEPATTRPISRRFLMHSSMS